MSFVNQEASPLSPRQAHCLALAREGKSSSKIGRELGISPKTVDQHIELARVKLQASTRVQAIFKAQAQGWLELT